jgi:phosphohistidine phosphatase
MTAIRHHGGDAPSLMVVAHNPGLHELGLALTRDGEREARRALENNLPTSGLIVIDFEIADWNDAGFRRGILKAFVSPKTLREAEQGGA